MIGINEQMIGDNFRTIQQGIVEAAIHAHRNPTDVKLVVVTKNQPIQAIQAVIEAGATILGENYADEALPKIDAIARTSNVEWHMIGHVQSRKAPIVAEHFSMVHSLDSTKLADRLNRFCGELGRRLPVLLELNLAREETKSGWIVGNETELSDIFPEIEHILMLPWIRIFGLMTMPPLCEDPEASRPFFRKLFAYSAILRDRYPEANWSELSIGTSADYEIAIEEGATMVRIGQAILGPRQKA